MSSQKDIALGMVALKFAMDQIAPAVKELRAQAGEELDPRDRVTAKAPDGTVLGTITKSAPKATVRVTDQGKFLSWTRENYPEHVYSESYISDADMEDACEALENAGMGHLVSHREGVKAFALNEVTKLSEKAGVPVGPGGEPDVPGIEVFTADGTVSTRVEKDAGVAIFDLLASGHVALDGTIRPALPGGAA